jgi:hypothetical protein
LFEIYYFRERRQFTPLLFLFILASCIPKSIGASPVFFNQVSAKEALKTGILNDDPKAIEVAISLGADVNEQGLAGITPLIYAVEKLKKKAVITLLENNAAPNVKNDKGDNAVTLAVKVFDEDPEILNFILQHGGDANTKRPNKNPIIVNFLNAFNHHGAKLLIEYGADIDARNRSKDPLVLAYAITDAWDNVWLLLEAGAQYDYPDEPMTWRETFGSPHVVSPNSAIWFDKVRVWKFLKNNEIDVPYDGKELVDPEYYNYLDDEGIERPSLEELLDPRKYNEYKMRIEL